MWRIWTTAAIAALSLVFCYVTMVYTDNATDEMISRVEELMQAKEGEAGVRERIKELYEDWEKHKKLISTFARHNEVEQVTGSLDLLDTIWESGTYNHFIVTCAEARFSLEHLRETEYPYLMNIL